MQRMSLWSRPGFVSRRGWLWLGLALLMGAAVAGSWWWSRQRPITVAVGVDLPLVPGAAIDPSDRNSADLWLEQRPGSRIRLVNHYNTPDPATAAASIAALKRQGVRFFVTTQASSHAVPSLPQFAGTDALAINVSAVSDQLSGKDDGFFRIVPDVTQEQRALARELHRLPGRRLLVLQDTGNRAWTDSAFAQFEAELNRLGGWTIIRRQLRVTDFDPQLHRPMLEGDVDALYLLAGAFLPIIGNISQLFSQLHPNAPILLTPWARSPAIVENAGPASARSLVVSPYPARREDPVVDRYFQRFEQRYGYTPYAMTIGTSQAIELLDQAFRSGATTPAQVKRYLLAQPVHQTRFGPVRFDANGDVRAEFHAFSALADRAQ
ncbi:putative ABC transporter/ periplasmic substrate-binding protein [Synechococcus sp. RS9909]|nr:ABC transporter, periplasmic substrate-binding protein, putative [Synechococcus sp. RS9917]QNI78889.1 putative ABC transporter/ periplasmic substrate-binding protein [Synechococcus sp. RS9909]